ncbi:hypothetical protein [Streptomyces canus]|uniref:hypothetical protein n=1 Tax=Streptomyces canus TaxID=58343 RepID=UPI00371869F0
MAVTVRRLEDELQRLNQVLRPPATRGALQAEIRRADRRPGPGGRRGKISDAPRFREHLRHMVVEHERSLKAHRGRMAARGQGTLTVEFRVLRMSPLRKLYFINSDVMYEGLCKAGSAP